MESNRSDTSTVAVTEAASRSLHIEVPADLFSNGGLRVVLIMRVSADTSAPARADR
eukprot:SAG31_NODE_10714_length_1107_cov_1.090278_2_plen_56_part_00